MTWHRTRVPFFGRDRHGMPTMLVVKAVRFDDCDAVPVEVNDDETREIPELGATAQRHADPH